jgi:hypothetical protein
MKNLDVGKIAFNAIGGALGWGLVAFLATWLILELIHLAGVDRETTHIIGATAIITGSLIGGFVAMKESIKEQREKSNG